MRTPLLCFFTIFIIECYAYDKYEKSKVFLLKNEKISHGEQLGLKLMNRRYAKLPTEMKKPNDAKDYTAFPANHRVDKVPSSALFQHDSQDAPKVRVKKVLPAFWNLSRKKRSPTSNATLSKITVKLDSVQSVTTAKAQTPKSAASQKAVKAVETTAPANSSVASRRHGKSLRSGHKKDKKDKKSSRSKSSHSKSHRSGKESKKQKAKSAKRNSHESRSSKKSSKKSGKRSSAKGAKVGGRRLIAGREAMIESYPYVVSIQKDGQHWCSGALLNQRLIITTANCVWKANRQSRMKIRACSRSVDSGGQVVRIAEVMKHPRWSIRKNPDNDLALLLTDGYIRFSHSCHAVDLPNRVMMPIFDDAWVASWGTERRDGVYVNRQPSTLQVYHSRVIDRKECNNVTMRFGVLVTENFICMEQTGRRAPCTRDTGAPAVSDGVLWGLASWGIRKTCGTERFPAMYSYTASLKNMDFILNATHLLMSEQRLSPFLDRYQQPVMQRANDKQGHEELGPMAMGFGGPGEDSKKPSESQHHHHHHETGIIKKKTKKAASDC